MITSEEMFALDTNCRYYGLTTLQLMENAGRAVAEEVKKRIKGEALLFLPGPEIMQETLSSQRDILRNLT